MFTLSFGYSTLSSVYVWGFIYHLWFYNSLIYYLHRPLRKEKHKLKTEEEGNVRPKEKINK